MQNIDEIDRRILQVLQHDARRPNNALAADAGVSPSTMLARVRRLEQAGAIRGYHADVDPAALGRNVEAVVSIKLQPKTNDAVDRFVSSLWALDEVVAITKVTGNFDLLVQVSVPTMEVLSDTVLGAIAGAPNVIDEQTAIVFSHRTKRVLTDLRAPDR